MANGWAGKPWLRGAVEENGCERSETSSEVGIGVELIAAVVVGDGDSPV